MTERVAIIPAPLVDEILTLEELASRLKLSPWTIRRLVRRRVLVPMRTGRLLRFHWQTVKVRLGADGFEGRLLPRT